MAHRQDENFITELFAYLIESLALEAPAAASRLITELVGLEQPVLDTEMSVRTQHHTEFGRPDLRIETSEFLAFVEVKVDAQLGGNQLPAYEKALWAEPTAAPARRLVLLSRIPIAIPEVPSCRTIKWDEIATLLNELLTSELQPVSRYVVEEFLHFMDQRGLKPPEVRSRVSLSIRSAEVQLGQPLALTRKFTRLEQLLEYEDLGPLHGLLSLVRDALFESRLFDGPPRFGSGQHSGGWIGWNLERMNYFVYVSWSQPEVLEFQRYEAPVDPEKWDGRVGIIERRAGRWRWMNHLNLLDERLDFFAASKQQQLNILGSFIEMSFREGTRLGSESLP